MNTPFAERIAQLVRQRGGRFFVPGHKGNPLAFPFWEDALPWDLTEIEGADNLMHPAAALAQSQRNMAKAYGAGATLYSAGGSTSCVEAMLALFLSPGDKVVMGRACHVSALRAAALLDLEPVWLLPGRDGSYDPVEAGKLLLHSGARALFVTSPDYYGKTTDIAALAEVCAMQGAKLLVDGAHGAHLVFFGQHPLALGADAVAESAHKTLPALTPAAMLHLKNGEREEAARSALNLFTSTSPSYPALVSLDILAGRLLSGELQPAYRRTAAYVEALGRTAGEMLVPCQDPCRLVIHPARQGILMREAAASLEQYGLTPELNDGRRLVFMCTPYNQDEDFRTLSEWLRGMPGRIPLAEREETPFLLPQQVLSVREALLAKNKKQLPVNLAAGRVAAEFAAPYPPGIPLLVPGERIAEETARRLAESGIVTLEVVS